VREKLDLTQTTGTQNSFTESSVPLAATTGRANRVRLEIPLGLGTTFQEGTLASSLEEVKSSYPWMREHLRLVWTHLKKEQISFTQWTDLDFSTFRTSQNSSLYDFGPLHAFQIQTLFGFNVLKIGSHSLEIGLSQGVRHHFREVSPQILGLQYGYSVGPHLRWEHFFSKKRRVTPYRSVLQVELPVLGVIWGHFASSQTLGELNWIFYQKKAWKIGISTTIEFRITRWFSRQQSQIESNFLVAPTFEWSSEQRNSRN
jgi:hypothetical protein